jgi:hypothetical protein
MDIDASDAGEVFSLDESSAVVIVGESVLTFGGSMAFDATASGASSTRARAGRSGFRCTASDRCAPAQAPSRTAPTKTKKERNLASFLLGTA